MVTLHLGIARLLGYAIQLSRYYIFYPARGVVCDSVCGLWLCVWFVTVCVVCDSVCVVYDSGGLWLCVWSVTVCMVCDFVCVVYDSGGLWQRVWSVTLCGLGASWQQACLRWRQQDRVDKLHVWATAADQRFTAWSEYREPLVTLLLLMSGISLSVWVYRVIFVSKIEQFWKSSDNINLSGGQTVVPEWDLSKHFRQLMMASWTYTTKDLWTAFCVVFKYFTYLLLYSKYVKYFAYILLYRGDVVVLLIRHRTCDLQVVGSSPGWAPLHSGLGQATYTCVPLSPSSIIWYRPRRVISLAEKVTVGLVESNDSLPPGLWLMSPVGWLPRNRDQLHAQRW